MLIRILFLILFVSFSCADETNSKHNVWIEWDSNDGMSRLQSSHAKENFWKLTRFYESQIRPTYCSVATSVIVLNALAIEAPKSEFLGKYRLFTQEEFFSESISAVINKNEVLKRGMSLGDLADVFHTFPITVNKYEAQSLSNETIKLLLISALKNPNQAVLALYQRKELDQMGGGHWSPIAAFDEESDSFLIMDVARFKYPPVWIDAVAFCKALQTSNIYGISRGFLIIENAALEHSDL